MAATNNTKFTEQQQVLFDKVTKERENVFFTGCGGTGKSFVIEHIVKALRSRTSHDAVAVTASTGRAAFNVRGTTLHSFAGVGLAAEDAEVLAKKVKFNSKSSERWKRTKVLIIDEISMISGSLFDKLEHVARVVRDNQAPFGGVQLVLVGDLLQLPPVGSQERAPRVFQALSWERCIRSYVRLDTVFRQSDSEFIKALACIRVGAYNDVVEQFMSKVCRPVQYSEDAAPVNLYATKSAAESFNSEELAKLDGEMHTYIATDRDYNKSGKRSTLLDSCPAVKELHLKKGAHVMLIRNKTRSLVNGTTGVVVGFASSTKGQESARALGILKPPIPIVRFSMADERLYTTPVDLETWESVLPNGNVVCSREQIPLIPSWAITIHKSQSQTIQHLKVDMAGIFETGQAYTALSRAVSTDTLEVTNFNPSSIKADTESVNFCLEHDLI